MNNEPRTVATTFGLPFALVAGSPKFSQGSKMLDSTNFDHFDSAFCELKAKPIPPVKNANPKIQLDCNKSDSHCGSHLRLSVLTSIAIFFDMYINAVL